MTCTRSGSARASSSASSPVPSGLPSSTIRMCTSGQRVVNPADDQRQVLPLVVGRDDDQRALTRAFTALDSRLPAVMWLLCRCCGAGVGTSRRRTNPPLCSIAAMTAANADSDQHSLDDRTPPRCRGELRLQPHLGVQVGGLEERGAGQLSSVRGDDGADPGGARDDDVAVVLDGPQPAERELLLAHRLVERGVVGGHGQQLRAVEHRLAGGAVEDHLPARGDPYRHARGVHHPGTAAGHEVAGAVGVRRQMAEEAAPRQVLAERLHDLLVVAIAGAGRRDPTRSPSWSTPGCPGCSRARRARRRPGSAR